VQTLQAYNSSPDTPPSLGLVKPDVITLVDIWYPARRPSCRWSGEGGGDQREWAYRRFTVARQRDAWDGLLQRKQGQTQRVNWHAIFHMPSGCLNSGYQICAIDISFIGYRLTLASNIVWSDMANDTPAVLRRGFPQRTYSTFLT